MKKILFLTSSNLASNPRLFKEICLARENNHQVTVIQFYLGNWSDAMTMELQSDFVNIRFIQLSALREPFLPWFLSTISQFFFTLISYRIFLPSVLSFAIDKRSLLLFWELKNYNESFDWVICHNPATFYPGLYFAKKKGARLGIDIEDYHPGETLNPFRRSRMHSLMHLVMPHADYCSYAAPLIADTLIKEIPALENNLNIILPNCFPQSEFIKPKSKSTESPLRLVWFSQNIDYGRGLENVILALEDFKGLIELHLIGDLKPKFGSNFIQGKSNIYVYAPMKQSDLHKFLIKFDVGLALDFCVNPNREIAVSNKIVTYAQSGLFILSMNTQGQNNFLEQNELLHIKIDNTDISVKEALFDLLERKSVGGLNSFINYNWGLKNSWDQLALPLLSTWEN
jgi:hypothetical protein